MKIRWYWKPVWWCVLALTSTGKVARKVYYNTESVLEHDSIHQNESQFVFWLLLFKEMAQDFWAGDFEVLTPIELVRVWNNDKYAARLHVGYASIPLTGFWFRFRD